MWYNSQPNRFGYKWDLKETVNKIQVYWFGDELRHYIKNASLIGFQ